MEPIDHFVADVEASGEDELMSALPELPVEEIYDQGLQWAFYSAAQMREYAIVAMRAYAAESVKQERERCLAILESEKKGWAYHQPSAYHVAESALDDAIEAIQKDQP